VYKTIRYLAAQAALPQRLAVICGERGRCVFRDVLAAWSTGRLTVARDG
jgi:hypothetical protein